ncbi:hypothetical protein MTO96_036837 [Rhipicephalus appendiculatus]
MTPPGTTRLGGRTLARRRRQRRRVGGRELRVVRFALRVSRQDERNDLVSEAFDIWRRVQADSSATLCQVQDSLPRRAPPGHELGEFDHKRNDVSHSSTPPTATDDQAAGNDQRPSSREVFLAAAPGGVRLRSGPRRGPALDGNKTWAFRQRGSSRPALTPDLFTEPGSKRSAVHSSPTKSQRPNVISPLLQELLREKDLDSDDKILKKMEFIVNHYRSRLDKGDCGDANGSSTLPKASHTAPTSPDSFCSPPCRRRGSKIPMATYYDRD